MKVSVIVPVRNREKYIGKCLESLLSQDLDKCIFEIIVVDNGSTDYTAQIIRSFSVKYLYLERPSISASRNLGIRYSQAEYVAFIDSDAEADKNWLRELLNGFNHPRVVGCGGKILLTDGKFMRRNLSWANYDDYIEHYQFILPAVLGVNAIFNRSYILNIGLFAEEPLLELEGEDVDLCWRIHLAGYRLKYIDSAVVYHRGSWSNLKGSFTKGYLKSQAEIILRQKYYFIDNLYERRINTVSFIIKTFLSFIQNKEENIFLLMVLKGIIFIFAYLLGMILFIIKKDKSPLFNEQFKLQIIKLTEKRPFGIIETQAIRLKIPKGVVWIGSNYEMRLANLISGEKNLLNEIGSFIWQQILDSKRKAEIVSDLERRYKVERLEAETDLDEFILNLKEHHFLEFFDSDKQRNN